MQRFKSKIGPEIVLFIGAVLIFVGTMGVINKSWPAIIIVAAVALFCAYLFSSIEYIIEDQLLIIKSGFFFTVRIRIESIKRLEETHNPLSSPAASLDRIAIYYNNFNVVLVSPKEKAEFINKLVSINPHIVVKLRRDKNKFR
ncbi:MAG TPA: PH domain-containing protein [Bacteroidales bacterium]|nr:PH domain-containing protein [Bacteroidales bacterium]